MKTQINNLQRGSVSTIGTSYEIRRQVAQKVKAENPKEMNIIVYGVEINLEYQESTTGKSFWYLSSHLPVEIVKKLFPSDDRAINLPELAAYDLTIDGDMRCEFTRYGRRTERAMWKSSSKIKVPEADITII